METHDPQRAFEEQVELLRRSFYNKIKLILKQCEFFQKEYKRIHKEVVSKGTPEELLEAKIKAVNILGYPRSSYWAFYSLYKLNKEYITFLLNTMHTLKNCEHKIAKRPHQQYTTIYGIEELFSRLVNDLGRSVGNPIAPKAPLA